MRTAPVLPQLALPMLALLAPACSSLPPARATAAAELPAQFQDWTLFDVAGQFVYAADADDAQEAAVLAATAGHDFRARTGREPAARLLLLADHDVWMPDGDPCRRLALALEGEAALHPRLEAHERHDGGSVPDSCEELHAESAGMGVEPRDMLCLLSHPVPVTRLVEDFGLPAGARTSWDWAVLLPAEDTIDDGMDIVMSAALKKELSFAERMLAAPLMPFMRGLAVDAMIAQERVLLFELHAAAQPDWTAAQRDQLVQAYEEALEQGLEAKAATPP